MPGRVRRLSDETSSFIWEVQIIKRVIMMCLSLILVCSMSISAFAVNRIGRAENETTQSVQMTDNQKGEAAATRQKSSEAQTKTRQENMKKSVLNRKQKTIQKNKRKIQKTQTTKEPKKIAQKRCERGLRKEHFQGREIYQRGKKHREKV